MSTRLTPRQRTFLDKVLDLCRGGRRPIHYSTVAERLSVGRTTAYEMLRLLEERGYVASEYSSEEEHPGPGRRRVVFYPTSKAHQASGKTEGAEEEEWRQVKRGILADLEGDRFPDADLLGQLLATIPQARSPLEYCAKIMIAVLLGIGKEVRSRLQEMPLLRIMSSDSPGQPGLGLLPGLLLGMLLAHQGDPHLVGRLIEYSKGYQRRLQEMDSEAGAALWSCCIRL